MTTTVDSLIAQIPPEPLEQFSPARYPYTYACDFIRQHPNVVPPEVRSNPNIAYLFGEMMARSEASQVLKVWAEYEGRDNEDMARVLADAFIVAHGIVGAEER